MVQLVRRDGTTLARRPFGAASYGGAASDAPLLKELVRWSRREYLAEMHRIAHGMKGQGGSFGFPLISRVGQSLCRFVGRDSERVETDLPVIQAHLDAQRLILEKGIRGDGGEAGRRLAERLETLTAGAEADTAAGGHLVPNSRSPASPRPGTI